MNCKMTMFQHVDRSQTLRHKLLLLNVFHLNIDLVQSFCKELVDGSEAVQVKVCDPGKIEDQVLAHTVNANGVSHFNNCKDK